MHNFLNFKLQKYDACQNGVEFCHKPIGDDVTYRCPSTVPSMKPLFYGTLYSMVLTFGCKVPSNNKLSDGTVPSKKQLFDGTVPSRKQLFDGTVPSRKQLFDGTPVK